MRRQDLRNLTVCSVDPPGCTDIDDALHCRQLENGNLEVLHTCTHSCTYYYVPVVKLFASKFHASLFVCYFFVVGRGPHC